MEIHSNLYIHYKHKQCLPNINLNHIAAQRRGREGGGREAEREGGGMEEGMEEGMGEEEGEGFKAQ